MIIVATVLMVRRAQHIGTLRDVPERCGGCKQMNIKALPAGLLSIAACLSVYLYAVRRRTGARWSRDLRLVRAPDVQGYPWENDPNYSRRASLSMCPYLEWAGWHSTVKAERAEFLEPAVVPALVRETPLPRPGCPW
eukprot:1227172-Amphidinium_carterae.1